ncbi:nucleoid-structuring protein H-NS [Brevundimonas intermedia]|uniref:Nucleoid-structuring protein H-NS n=1 Tax=Brevundimonas intermedia TaxID=74315 RepID=A0ABQ5TE10_9CAUL|nr:phage major capsid protein [Brevundimonas intermedia]GLK49498.1 nucleoid-structuring protein H-NS [Brevundimonas intermedia]
MSDDIKEIRQQLERVTGDVKQTAEKALKQAEDTGKVTDEVKQTADKLLVEQKALQGKLEAVEERQQQLEQSAANRREQDKAPPKSLGQAIAESDGLKAFIAQGAKGTQRIEVNNVITSASAGGLITPTRDGEIVSLRRRQPRIRSLLNQGRTNSSSVEYARQTARTNNAAVVAENTLKAESNYAWAKADAIVRTIAHWVPISRNTLDDAAALQTELDSELRYGLDIAEDEELLNGDGTGEHLDGLRANATAYAAPFSIEDETPIDTLRLALLQLELQDYAGDGFILNPMEWARIELTKNQFGSYIFANVLQLAGPTLWGRSVVATTAMDAGDFMAGEFGVAATIYDRMDAEVLFSTEDRDNFVKNMITARAEKRLAFAVKRETALVDGTFPLAA